MAPAQQASATPIVILALALLGVVLLYGLQVEPMEKP